MADCIYGVVFFNRSKALKIVCGNHLYDAVSFRYYYENNFYDFESYEHHKRNVINKKCSIISSLAKQVSIPTNNNKNKNWKIMYNVHSLKDSIENCTFSLYDERGRFKTCIRNEELYKFAGMPFNSVNNIFVSKMNIFFNEANKLCNEPIFDIGCNAMDFNFSDEKENSFQGVALVVEKEKINNWEVKKNKRKILLD